VNASPPARWFLDALARPGQSRWVDSLGARIHYLAWDEGAVDRPGLLLVHGMLAHAHWWDFVAPFFTDRFRVYALDLSGMGESGHRKHYPWAVFVNDMAAVIRREGISPAVVVAHSFGGSRLLDACAWKPEMIRHAVVMDSRYEPATRTTSDRPVAHVPRATEREAMDHYRLMPEQPCPPWIREHLARHSVKLTAAGWVWRFDPRLRVEPLPPNNPEVLRAIEVPLDYVYGERSALVSAQRARDITSRLPHGRAPVVVAGAGHHLMLDRTLELVDTLNRLLPA
jgi:pimeloyl-ACP methyl ester carboxylesterase